jgi:hypothetical protein
MRLRRFLGIVIACITATSMVTISTVAVYTGTASDPFPIRDMMDFKRVSECMRVNKSWSDGKHFSLRCDIEMELATPLAPSATEGYKFRGIFHGNGYTITLPKGGNLFGYIDKDAVVEDLTVAGKGQFAQINAGLIKNCKLTGETPYMVGDNSGTIQDCEVMGKVQHGITNSNRGTITRCLIDAELSNSGISANNEQLGKISHCRVKGAIKAGYNLGGLLGWNGGLIENCTMDAVLEGSSSLYGYYLIYNNNTNKETMARRCVVGKNAKGAHEEMMFGSVGNVEECGYEDWDQTDHCKLVQARQGQGAGRIDTRGYVEEGAKLVGSAAFGVLASAVDGFIKGPIEIIGWAVPESGAKDFLQGVAKGVGGITYALEALSSNPKVFKVAKIGTDIAGVFVGTKGLVTAVTKAGQAVKIGQAAESLKYMVSGGAAALARDVVFVAEGTALAEVATTVTASLLLAEGSSKTLHDDMSSGSSSSSSSSSSKEIPEQLKTVDTRAHANELAKKLGYKDAEDFKASFVSKINVSNFNIKYNPKTREIFLERIQGTRIQMSTGHHLPVDWRW